MNTLKKIAVSIFLLGVTSFLHAQDIAKKYDGGINGLGMDRAYTKQEIIAEFGNPTQYNKTDYTDEGLGVDEKYIYDKELRIKCTDGEIREIWTNSPKYLFFNHIRVGDPISKAYEMINDGFARMGITKREDDDSYSLHVYLGDMSFYIYYDNNIIDTLYYQEPL